MTGKVHTTILKLKYTSIFDPEHQKDQYQLLSFHSQVLSATPVTKGMDKSMILSINMNQKAPQQYTSAGSFGGYVSAILPSETEVELEIKAMSTAPFIMEDINKYFGSIKGITRYVKPAAFSGHATLTKVMIDFPLFTTDGMEFGIIDNGGTGKIVSKLGSTLRKVEI